MKEELLHAFGNALLSLKQLSVLASRCGASRASELDAGLSHHYTTKKFLTSMTENSLNKLAEDVVKLTKMAVALCSSLQPDPNDIRPFLLCFSTLQQAMWALSDELLLAEQLTGNVRYAFLSSELFASAHDMHVVIDGVVKKDPTLPKTLVCVDVKTALCGLVLRVTDCVVASDGNDGLFLLAAVSILLKEFVVEPRCESLVRSLPELVRQLLTAKSPAKTVIREDIADALSRLLAQTGEVDDLSIESARKKLEKLERKKIDDPIVNPLPSLAAKQEFESPAPVVLSGSGLKFASHKQLLDAVLAKELSPFDFVLTFGAWCRPDEFIQLLHSRVTSHAECIEEMLTIFQTLFPKEYLKHEALIAKLLSCLGKEASLFQKVAAHNIPREHNLLIKCDVGRFFVVHTAEEIADGLCVIDKVLPILILFCLCFCFY
jgi:hypothetical protein